MSQYQNALFLCWSYSQCTCSIRPMEQFKCYSLSINIYTYANTRYMQQVLLFLRAVDSNSIKFRSINGEIRVENDNFVFK